MGEAVEVLGLKELDEALAELSTASAKGVLRRVGRQALQPFDEAWRERAPRDTGRLAESGGIGSGLSRRQRQLHTREDPIEVFAGPGPAAEAVQQEFGNSHNPPQPFVRPAWDATQSQVLQGVIDGLAPEIDKAAQRAARKAARLAAKNAG